MEDLSTEISKHMEQILGYLQPIITELNKQPKFLCIKIANCLDLMYSLLWNAKIIKCKNKNDYQEIIKPNITKLIDTLGQKLKQKINHLIQSEYVKNKGNNSVYKNDLEEIRKLLLSCYDVIGNMTIDVKEFFKLDIDQDWGEFCDNLDQNIEKYENKQFNGENHDLAYVIWMEITTSYFSQQDQSISLQDIQSLIGQFLNESVAVTDKFIRRCVIYKLLPEKITSMAQIIFFLNRVMADSSLKYQLMNEGEVKIPKQNLLITVKLIKTGENLLKGNQVFKINELGLISSNQYNQYEQYTYQEQQKKQQLQQVQQRKSYGETIFGRRYSQLQFKKNDVDFSEVQTEISRQQFKIICNAEGFYFISCLASNDTRILVQNNHFYKLQLGSNIIIKQDLINIDVMEFKQQQKQQEDQDKYTKEVTSQVQTKSIDKNQDSTQQQDDDDRTDKQLGDSTGFINKKDEQGNKYRITGDDDDPSTQNNGFQATNSKINNGNSKEDIDKKQIIQINEKNVQSVNSQQNEKPQYQDNSQFVDSPPQIYEKLKNNGNQKNNLDEINHLKIRFRTKQQVQTPQDLAEHTIKTSPFIIKLNKEQFQDEENGKADLYIISKDGLTRKTIVLIFQYNETKKQWEIASLEEGRSTDIALSLKLNFFKNPTSKEIVDKRRYQYQLMVKDFIQAGENKFEISYEEKQDK